MGTKFRLVGNKRNVLYEGYMEGDRLERTDICVDNDTYLDIIDKVKYILWEDYIYNFEAYVDETMTEDERNMKIGKRICYDNEKRKKIHINKDMDCSEQDFLDYCEYIREHKDC